MSGNSWGDDDDDSEDWVGSDDQHDDDHDDGALDFGAPVADGDDEDDDWSGLGALDTPAAATDDEDDTELDPFDYAPVPTAADDGDIGALDHLVNAHDDGAEEDAGAEVLLFSATHPSRMITVEAVMSGRIQRVELAPEVARMTESQLTQAIMTTAELASVKARSVQYQFVQGLMDYQGLDRDTVTTFLDEYVHLPTPAQAAAAEAEVTSQYLRGDLR